jgi:hypothetical protein
MNTGNLQAARGRIEEALEQLRNDWRAASETWADQNAAQFAEIQLQPVWEEFQTALPAISQLVQVVQAAGRDLEE